MLLFDAGGHSTDRLYELVMSTCSAVAVVDSSFSQDEAMMALKRSRALVIGGRRRASATVDRLVSSLIHGSMDGGKPVIGICYGAQIINNLMGGSLEVMPRRLRGFNHVLLDPDDPAFRGLPLDHARFYEARARRIRKLGRGLRPIAWSSGGIEAFKGEGVYGFLFHPELSGGAGVVVMRSVLHHLGLV